MSQLSIVMVSLLLASCDDTESWRDPETREQSVLAIQDSLLSDEQRELKHNIETYINTDDIFTYHDGHAVVKTDMELLSSLGISPSYVKLIQEDADSHIQVFYEQMNADLQAELDNGAVWLYDGGSGITIARSDSDLDRIGNDKSTHIYTGTITHLVDSVLTSSNKNEIRLR